MESENILIRKSIFDDCEIFTRWEQQDYVKEFLTINKERTYEEVVREFILREQDPSNEQYTIIHKNKPIGRIYLSKISKEFDSIDITRIYIGEKEYLGKGYGRECMELLLDYCFNELKMERVSLDHYTGNAAGELYLKLGFKYEGVMRNSAKKDNEYFDLHLMSMLREEYKKTI
ncbi:MAG TPA: GNAT family protein [Sedimentibacter sp.]|jgi:RimJ/RimL family protein N-acetyltransferase|nr:GNAT family N-acetyltransferase [Sedimentibacter sp.]HNZ82544.1 GNAT family protein [Sedimentibacter sp.]HOH69386.1 GNAT family protein [Sedimentibacter sp.]